MSVSSAVIFVFLWRRTTVDNEVVHHRIADNVSTVVATVLLLPSKVVNATKSTARSPPPLHVGVVPPVIGDLGDTLREIDVDTVVVDQDAVHLEICLFTFFLVRVLDKGILEAVAGLLVAYDFAAYDLSKP